MVRAGILLVLFVSLAANVGAQGRPGQQAGQGRGSQGQGARPAGPPSPQRLEWWQREEIRTGIGLRKDQAAKIEGIYQALIPRLRSSTEDRMKAEEQLSKLFSSDTATEDIARL